MSHLAGRLCELPFTGTDYQEVGLREKLDVDVIRECKGDQGEEEDEENTTNKPEGPAFWDPDHMQETGYCPGGEERIEAMGSTQRTLMMPEQKQERTGAQAKNPQNFPQIEGGAQDKARSLADKQEVTRGAVLKQTMISGENGE